MVNFNDKIIKTLLYATRNSVPDIMQAHMRVTNKELRGRNTIQSSVLILQCLAMVLHHHGYSLLNCVITSNFKE